MELAGAIWNGVWTAALPVGVLTCALVAWALRSGSVTEGDGLPDLQAEIARLGKHPKKGNHQRSSNPLQEKWLRLGGGFYGAVGLYTWILVEWPDLMGLVRGLGGLFSSFGVNLLVDFVVDSIKNFVTAIAWPGYWLGRPGVTHFWVWFLLAYAGYWAGLRLAGPLAARLPPPAVEDPEGRQLDEDG